MEHDNLNNLSKDALLQEQKKIKTTKTTSAFLMGLLIGIAVYSAVKNGIGFFTFFPLFFVYLLYNKGAKSKESEKEIEYRLKNKAE